MTAALELRLGRELVGRHRRRDERRRDARLLLDARRLAGEIAQVEEARATDAAARDHIDLLDARRVQREDALDADAVADLADGERRAVTGAGLANDHALERLRALLLAFLDEDRHLDGVAHLEVGEGLGAQ